MALSPALLGQDLPKALSDFELCFLICKVGVTIFVTATSRAVVRSDDAVNTRAF